MAQTQEFIATGRRKTSVARIRMTPGDGKIDINGKSFEDYFPTVPLQNTVLQPLQVVKLTNSYDLSINTTGGGATGQAGAVLRLSRAPPRRPGLAAGVSRVPGCPRERPWRPSWMPGVPGKGDRPFVRLGLRSVGPTSSRGNRPRRQRQGG